MALWGKSDSIYSIGTIDSIDYTNKVIIGSGTSFTAAEIGDVITIGVGATYGEAIITGITSDTRLSIASTAFLIGQIPSGGGAGVAYTMSEKPVYTLHDSNYTAKEIYGVDTVETGYARTTAVGGKAGAYGVSHAGWVGIQTYTDMHGNLRVKSEVLVAMSGITTGTPTYAAGGDANGDDAIFNP